jgi:hypothetical protein
MGPLVEGDRQTDGLRGARHLVYHSASAIQLFLYPNVCMSAPKQSTSDPAMNCHGAAKLPMSREGKMELAAHITFIANITLIKQNIWEIYSYSNLMTGITLRCAEEIVSLGRLRVKEEELTCTRIPRTSKLLRSTT